MPPVFASSSMCPRLVKANIANKPGCSKVLYGAIWLLCCTEFCSEQCIKVIWKSELQGVGGVGERGKKSLNPLATGGVACKHIEHLLGLGGQKH